MRLDLGGLEAALREALIVRVARGCGPRPTPKHLSRSLMIQILSHAYQLETVGGYAKRAL